MTDMPHLRAIRKQLADALREGDRLNAERRECRMEAVRLRNRNPLPRWFNGDRTEWQRLIHANFGDVL